MKLLGSIAAVLLLAACGNPGGIADAEYAKYKELGAPKILNSCTKEGLMSPAAVAQCMGIENANEKIACLDNALSAGKKPIVDVGYTAGVGIAATYNKILSDAKNGCSGDFKILESKQ